MNLTEKMFRLRSLFRYKQAYVADRLGITQSAYSQLENGRIQPSLLIVEKLSALYGIHQADFLSQSATSLIKQIIDKQPYAGK